MWIVPESAIPGLVDEQSAFDAIEATFAAMSRGDAYNFPVVREALGEGRQYGFKSGLDRIGALLGVKAGGIFPEIPSAAFLTTRALSICSILTVASRPPWSAATC